MSTNKQKFKLFMSFLNINPTASFSHSAEIKFTVKRNWTMASLIISKFSFQFTCKYFSHWKIMFYQNFHRKKYVAKPVSQKKLS